MTRSARAPRPRAILLGALSALVVLSACGGTKDGLATGPRKALVAVATPPGFRMGAPAVGLIDQAGGALATSDGALVVTLPPEAVNVSAEFSITPISNTARGAVGPAFRLAPDGATFGTPITLTFRAPETFATGAALSRVGVSYQDALGFWHPVEPVARDAAANTVSVQVTHFSDWALVWTSGIPVAEGPIELVQTYTGLVGDGATAIPFVATGTATLFLASAGDGDTNYVLTGTLALPAHVPYGDADCVPVEPALALPPNAAEVHGGSPPVFRWGIGVSWELACTSAGGDVTSALLPALFDTMQINLTRCGGSYADGQVVSPDRLAGSYTKDCGGDGIVRATWDLRACLDGQTCALGDCRLGQVACGGGGANCLDAGPAPAGTACGAGLAGVCDDAGACVVP